MPIMFMFLCLLFLGFFYLNSKFCHLYLPGQMQNLGYPNTVIIGNVFLCLYFSMLTEMSLGPPTDEIIFEMLVSYWLSCKIPWARVALLPLLFPTNFKASLKEFLAICPNVTWAKQNQVTSPWMTTSAEAIISSCITLGFLNSGFHSDKGKIL